MAAEALVPQDGQDSVVKIASLSDWRLCGGGQSPLDFPGDESIHRVHRTRRHGRGRMLKRPGQCGVMTLFPKGILAGGCRASRLVIQLGQQGFDTLKGRFYDRVRQWQRRLTAVGRLQQHIGLAILRLHGQTEFPRLGSQ